MNWRRAHHLLTAHSLLALVVLMLFVTSGAASLVKTPGDSNQLVVGQASAQTASINFGVVFSRASYGNPEKSYNTVAVQNADLSMLLSTNAGCIRIDIGYAPWLQNNQTAINAITSLVQAVRTAGRCLIIADAASETYRQGGQIPWDQFKGAWVSRVSTLAALYHPDYYVVVKEPGWYVPFVSDATTNPNFQSVNDWLGLTQNLTKAVQEASPNTVGGVAIAANSLAQANGAFYSQYLNQVQAISGISFIGFDIYSQIDQTNTQSYLSKNPPTKAVWIPEAWSNPKSAPLDGSPSQDAQWIQSIYGFALSIHAAFLIPFYTDAFASYSLTASSPTSSDQILSLYQQRTPIFSAFQSIVAAASGSSATTSTSAGISSTSSQTSSSTSSPSSLSSASTSAVVSSSRTSHTSTSGARTSGGNGFSSALVVALAVAVLVVLVGLILYYRRRR